MKLLRFLTFGPVASCLALPNLSLSLSHTIQTRDTRSLYNNTSSLAQDAKLLPRSITEAYKVAQEAVPTQLEPGQTYFFLNCAAVPEGTLYPGYDPNGAGQAVIDKLNCQHVGLVVGKVSESGDDFIAKYYHATVMIYIQTEKETMKWKVNYEDWKPMEGLKLIYGYGGPTDAEKADPLILLNRSSAWTNKANNKWNLDYNSWTYYLYITKDLRT